MRSSSRLNYGAPNARTIKNRASKHIDQVTPEDFGRTRNRENIVSVNEKIFFAGEKIFSPAEKIFSAPVKACFVTEKMFFVTKRMFFVTEKMFFVTEKMFFVAEKMFFVAEKMFFVAEKMFFVTKNIFFVAKNMFSAPMETIDGSALGALVHLEHVLRHGEGFLEGGNHRLDAREEYFPSGSDLLRDRIIHLPHRSTHFMFLRG